MPEHPPTGTNSGANSREPVNPAAPRVVIVGASARAAAYSAIRAGWSPVGIDQFADLDLQRFASATAVEDYPGGIIRCLDQVDETGDLPVVYTGAMENHPRVLSEIASRQPVLGNDAGTLAAVRDPLRVHKVLSESHVSVLEVRSADDPPPADGTWLLKPRGGAGGRGITVWSEAAAASATLTEPHYFQKYSAGRLVSAVYVAGQEPLQLQYVGLTEQLVGREELNAPPFAWCGSIGAVALDTRGEILARRIGTVLTHRFGLRGLFGCDFVLNDDGEPALIEVNPRYTGSVEVLELLCGSTLFTEHCRATGGELPEGLDARPSVVPTGMTVGKAVLFCDRDLIAPDTTGWQHITPWQPLPGFADVPQPGSVIRNGSPVCSIFAAAESFDGCEGLLLESAVSVKDLLAGCPNA